MRTPRIFYNYRIIQVRRDLRKSQSYLWDQIVSLRAVSNWVLKFSEDGGSTTSLDNLFWCWVVGNFFMVKKLLTVSRLVHHFKFQFGPIIFWSSAMDPSPGYVISVSPNGPHAAALWSSWTYSSVDDQYSLHQTFFSTCLVTGVQSIWTPHIPQVLDREVFT